MGDEKKNFFFYHDQSHGRALSVLMCQLHVGASLMCCSSAGYQVTSTIVVTEIDSVGFLE
jgi:hypothetical protein